MQFAYTIIYVPDVAASLSFFEQAFGLQRRFLHESGTYGELDTGATTLAFAAHAMGPMNISRPLCSCRPLFLHSFYAGCPASRSFCRCPR